MVTGAFGQRRPIAKLPDRCGLGKARAPGPLEKQRDRKPLSQQVPLVPAMSALSSPGMVPAPAAPLDGGPANGTSNNPSSATAASSAQASLVLSANAAFSTIGRR